MGKYTKEETRPVLEAIVRSSTAAAIAEAEVIRSAGKIERYDNRDAIRAMLKAAGIPVHKLSIKASYRGSSKTDVKIPAARFVTAEDARRQVHLYGKADAEVDDAYAQLAQAAWKRVRYLIELAFPELTDRSDMMTDYFDFVWSVDLQTWKSEKVTRAAGR